MWCSNAGLEFGPLDFVEKILNCLNGVDNLTAARYLVMLLD